MFAGPQATRICIFTCKMWPRPWEYEFSHVKRFRRLLEYIFSYVKRVPRPIEYVFLNVSPQATRTCISPSKTVAITFQAHPSSVQKKARTLSDTCQLWKCFLWLNFVLQNRLPRPPEYVFSCAKRFPWLLVCVLRVKFDPQATRIRIFMYKSRTQATRTCICPYKMVARTFQAHPSSVQKKARTSSGHLPIMKMLFL